MRRFVRGPVRLRDERPANWNEDDEARFRIARERWQLWAMFWVAGTFAAILGAGTVTLSSPLVLWVLAALMGVPLGAWTGPTLPDLVRRNEDARKNARIAFGVTLLLCSVGTISAFGALVWLNTVFDLAPRQSATFQVLSVTRTQGRSPFSRVVMSSRGQQIVLDGTSPRSPLKAGQAANLPVGRGLFRVQWLDASRL